MLALFLAAAFVASAHALARALELRVGLHALLGARLRFWLAALAAACVLAFAALALELAALKKREAERALAPLASLPPVLVAAWIAFLAFVQPFQRVWFDVALGIAAGAWAGLVLLERRSRAAPPRALRLASTILLALAIALPLVELGLRALAARHRSPLLARVGDAPRALIERFRCRAGEERFGFACNARGFYDEEPRRRAPGEQLVVSIGDSFNVGMVPHALHYTTLCETRLGTRVANLGVPGIGPTEYVRLLVDEAMPLDPDLVVISIFVGNDLDCADPSSGLPDRGLRSWLERERVLLWVLPGRWARYAREEGLRGEPASGANERAGSSASEAESLESLALRFPFVTDWRLEAPALGVEGYLRLETRRALSICARDPLTFDSFAASMRAARAAAGDATLCAMLVPDELQVEDELWERVRERAGVELERDRAQRVTKAWLAREGIPCLDLLPLLRAVPPLEDGARHLYHLRDTHFNARGNRVAGEALAEFLRPLLAARER